MILKLKINLLKTLFNLRKSSSKTGKPINKEGISGTSVSDTIKVN